MKPPKFRQTTADGADGADGADRADRADSLQATRTEMGDQTLEILRRPPWQG